MQFPTLKDAARHCEKNHVPSMVTKVFDVIFMVTKVSIQDV